MSLAPYHLNIPTSKIPTPIIRSLFGGSLLPPQLSWAYRLHLPPQLPYPHSPSLDPVPQRFSSLVICAQQLAVDLEGTHPSRS